MAAPSQISYRPAVFRDCEPVMAINRNVYGGLDYLLYKFHSHIADPFRFPFVAVADGTVVGFQCAYVIDDGLSIVSEAARVNPDFQGRGIMSRLDEESQKAARSQFPRIRRQLWTTVDMERSTAAINKANSTTKMLEKKPRVSFDSTCSALSALCASSSFNEQLTQSGALSITAVPRRQAIELLTHNIDFSRVAPSGVLLVNFEPWGLHRATFVELLRTSALHVSPPDGATSGKVDCFSFLSETTTAVGVRCRVDLFCPPGEAADGRAAAHLLYHVREVAACRQNNAVSFSMLFPDHIDKRALKALLTDHLGLHNDVSPESTGLILGRTLPEPQPKL